MSSLLEDAQPEQQIALLEVRGLSKSYGPARVLDQVSLSVARGQVVGLIGANGAGKSTLIKCLIGAVLAEEGHVLIDGVQADVHTPEHALRLGLSAVQQEIMLANDHSVAENVLLGRLPAAFGFTSQGLIAERAKPLLDMVGLHVDPHASAGSLTPSAKRLVMIAAVLARKPRLVILDEPTAALPPEESAVVLKLVRDLSADGVSVIYVSHRLHEVQELASTVVALRNGQLSGVLSGREVTRSAMLSLIGGQEEPETLLLTEEHVHSEVRVAGDVVLEVRGLSGSRVRNVNFEARRGEILGIAGLAGSGRSELLRLLYGVQPATAGEIHFDGSPLSGGLRERVRRRIGYVAELRGANIFRGLAVSRNLTISSIANHRVAGVFADSRWETETAKRIATEVSLVGRPNAAIETLSGGNQQKILISRWLVRDTQLLLLDEPTAGVDLLARAEIHELLHRLSDQGKTVVVASVEADELTTICDRVLVMVEGAVVRELTSPFSEADLVSAYYHREVPGNLTHAPAAGPPQG